MTSLPYFKIFSFAILFLYLPDFVWGQADHSTELTIEGLQEPVEILKDAWGVSHIYAETEEDLFFAQGYNAARDRLFQLEIWRRQATGTMAELLGERMVEHDIGARLMKFRGDLQAEMKHYHDRGDVIIPAFTKGINAYIDEVLENPDLLPLEFQLLDFKPQKWTPEIVISRHQGLVGNVGQELELVQAVNAIGEEKVKDLIWFHPDEPDLKLDEKIDASLLTNEVLKLYNEARSSVEFRPEDIVPEYRTQTSSGLLLNQGSQDTYADKGPSVLGENYDEGSNNWVIEGSMSESGYPMMANDPHRVVQAPSLRYFVHLNGPGWNVSGGGEPALPGISIGHNGYGAWGLTIFRLDSEDLLVYETHPDDPNRYQYNGEWEPMKVEETVIEVKGSDPVVTDLKFTRHGPVIHERSDANTSYALRLAWLEVGSAPYLGSLRMNQAKSWQEFREACEYSRLPGENMVWADRDGNIGYQAVGIAPLRPNWHGLLPVPGDGSYEWDGYLPVAALPNEHNPDQGFWNTSNENLIPDDYKFRNAAGWTWSDPYRSHRVREVLQSGKLFNLQDMAKLQNDVFSIPASTIVPLLKGLGHPDEQVSRASEELLNWDYRMEKHSIAAGIYMEWEKQVRQRVSDLYIPEEAEQWLGWLQMKPTVDRLLSPDGQFGENPSEGRNRLLLESLEEAVSNLSSKFGSDMGQWQYGQPDYKHVHMRHPMSDVVTDEIKKKIEVGPAPQKGYSYTVNNAGYENNQTHGGTFRLIVDTEDFDRTLASTSPGQSGDPDSPFYDNMFEEWVNDRYFPLFYSREKIESVTK
ncbi:MAG: penicillin acylase family protein, partial [Balneolales bacterium]